MKTKYYPLALLTLFILQFGQVYSQNLDYFMKPINKLEDSTLKVLLLSTSNPSASILVSDIPGDFGGNFQYKDLFYNVKVRLYYDLMDINKPALLEKLTINPTLEVLGKVSAGATTSSYNETFNLSIGPDQSFCEKTINFSEFPNGNSHFYNIGSVGVTLNKSDFDHLDTLVLDAIRLEVYVDIYRYNYELVPTTPSLSIYESDPLDANNELKENQIVVSWEEYQSPVSYELEWLYVPSQSSHINYNFNERATRVITKNNYYSLSNIYPKGALVFRVRTVKPNISSDSNTITTINKYGEWSTPSIGSGVNVSSNFIYSNSSSTLLDSLNWQFTQSFSSQGKNKELIRFYDGSNRERQAVTVLSDNSKSINVNSNKSINQKTTVIAQESYYDYSGKPVMNMMPSPLINSNYLGYQKNLNLVSGTNEKINPSIFDDITNFFSILPKLDTNSAGAAQYYSGSNPELIKNSYIPNAGQYPFSFTEYTADGSNRVRSNYSAGKVFAENKKLNTTYKYAKATQSELDRIFGSDVGFFEFYKKDVAIDPNGQISFVYKDIKDRTIATSIAGSPNPESFMDIIAPPANSRFIDNLIGNYSDVFIEAENEFRMSYPLFVPEGAMYRFRYGFDVENYQANCEGSLEICYDCRYIYSFKIYDEKKVLVASLYDDSLSFDTNSCSSPVGSYRFKSRDLSNYNAASISGDTLIVQLGSNQLYTIEKSLKLQTNKLDEYALDAFNTVDCTYGSEYFEKIELDSSNFLTCETDLSEFDQCAPLLKEMIFDFTPNGYFLETGISNPVNGNSYAVASQFFHLIGQTFDSPYLIGRVYFRLATTYGAKSFVDSFPSLASFQKAFLDEFGLTTQPFIDDFLPEYAEYFVQFHPNYCNYQTCRTFYPYESMRFLKILEESETVEDFNTAVQILTYVNGEEMEATTTTIGSTDPLSQFHDDITLFAFDSLMANLYVDTSIDIYEYGFYSSFLQSGNHNCYVNFTCPPTPVSSGYVPVTLYSWLDSLKISYFEHYFDCVSDDSLAGKGISELALNTSEGEDVNVWSTYKRLYMNVRKRVIDEAILTNACEKSKPDTAWILELDEDSTYFPYNGRFGPFAERDSFFTLPYFVFKGNKTSYVVLDSKSTSDSIRSIAKNFSSAAISIAELLVTDSVILRDSANPSSQYNAIINYLSDTTNFKNFVCDPNTLIQDASISISLKDLFLVNISVVVAPYLKHYVNKDGSGYFACPQITAEELTCSMFKSVSASYIFDSLPNLISDSQIFIHDKLQKRYKNWMNYKLGLNLSFADYYYFSSDCTPQKDTTLFGDTIQRDSVSVRINTIREAIVSLLNAGVEFKKIDNSTLYSRIDSIIGIFGFELDSLKDVFDFGYLGVNSYQNHIFYSDDRDTLANTLLEFSAIFDAIKVKLKLHQNFESSFFAKTKKIDFSGSIVGLTGKKVDRAYRYSNGTVWVRVVNSDDTYYNDYYYHFQPYNYRFKINEINSINTIKPLFHNSELDYFELGINNSDLTIIASTLRPVGSVYNMGAVVLSDIKSNDQIPFRQTCEDLIYERAKHLAILSYNEYKEEFLKEFKFDYKNYCLNQKPNYKAFTNQFLNMEYDNNEHQFTLYYYDQAENLVQTIPPKGFNSSFNLTPSVKADIEQYRSLENKPAKIDPGHSMATTYQYNSDNQIIIQTTPNGGVSYFWYDKAGRLVLSQNQKQRLYNQYSYSLFDELSRIIETGQAEMNEFSGMPWDTIHAIIHTRFIDSSGFPSSYILTNRILAKNDRRDVVKTYYDLPVLPSSINYFSQENLRSRVATSAIYRSSDDPMWLYATHYSYDPLGNVKTLIHDYSQNNRITDEESRYKRLDYYYDQISGNVNRVYFQLGKSDQMVHQYTYDAENRITKVETSEDGVIWDEDANYEYYLHGPLARTVLGEHKVQGIDYAYTLQGWLKSVNSAHRGADIGHDKILNSIYAKDVFGFALNYFDGDYSPINSDSSNFLYSNIKREHYSNLYNGNINGIDLFNDDFEISKLYTYDQLNRITFSDEYIPNLVDTAYLAFPSTNSTHYEYDRNGNITSLDRQDGESQSLMDDLSYTYESETDRLLYVSDPVANSTFPNDIDQQPMGNYTYDDIGNLISDSSELIQSIQWTTAGKVKSINRSIQPTKQRPNLAFEYDAMGNRIKKTVSFVDLGRNFFKSTYYVRDAQGNTMATYDERDCTYENSDDSTGSSYYQYSEPYKTYSYQTADYSGVHSYLTLLSSPADDFTREIDLKNSAFTCLDNVSAIKDSIIDVIVPSDYITLYPIAVREVIDYDPYDYAVSARNSNASTFYNLMNYKNEVWIKYLQLNSKSVHFYDNFQSHWLNLSSTERNEKVWELFSMQKDVILPIYSSSTADFHTYMRTNSSYDSDIVTAIGNVNDAKFLLSSYLDDMDANCLQSEDDNAALKDYLLQINVNLLVSDYTRGEMADVFDGREELITRMRESFNNGWLTNNLRVALMTNVLHILNELEGNGSFDMSIVPDYSPMYGVKWNVNSSGSHLNYFIHKDYALPVMQEVAEAYITSNSYSFTSSSLYIQNSSTQTLYSYVEPAMLYFYNNTLIKSAVINLNAITVNNLSATQNIVKLKNYFKQYHFYNMLRVNYYTDSLDCALLGIPNYSPFKFGEEMESLIPGLSFNFGIDCVGDSVYTVATSYDIYGSSRLGTLDARIRRLDSAGTYSRKLRAKTYELTDHLGNVMATISDKKLHPQEYLGVNGSNSSGTNEGFKADVTGQYDRYPFGMEIASRSGDFNFINYQTQAWIPIYDGLLKNCDDFQPNNTTSILCSTATNLYNQEYIVSYTATQSPEDFNVSINMRLSEIIPNLDPTAIYSFEVRIEGSSGRAITASMDTASLVIADQNGNQTPATVKAAAVKIITFNMTGAALQAMAVNGKATLSIAVGNAVGFASNSIRIENIKINQYVANSSQQLAIRIGAGYKYGFNGYERDDELKGSGNSYDFGARMYDPRIAKFLSTDPREKDYPYWSPYLFAANNPIRFIDVNGEGPGDKFKTVDAAVIDFAKKYNPKSIRKGKEYSSPIIRVVKGGEIYYKYAIPTKGSDNSSPSPSHPNMVASVHTHGSSDKEYLIPTTDNVFDFNEEFSPSDIDLDDIDGLPGYIVTPGGRIKKHIPAIDKSNPKKPKQQERQFIELDVKDIPSDPNSPSRINDVSPDRPGKQRRDARKAEKTAREPE